MDALFNELFTPAAVAYLSRQVDAAIAQATEAPGDRRSRLEQGLARAKLELENVLTAIRQGLLTPATRGLLDACERRVTECEMALRVLPTSTPPVASLSTVITRYLNDLRATLSTDVESARMPLARGIRSVILRREGSRLMAEIEGDLVGLLELEEGPGSDNHGAGSPIPMQPSTVVDRRVVA